MARLKRKPYPSWVVWAIVAGVWIFLIPFYYFDLMDLALPSLLAVAVIGCAITTFWKSRKQRWFWIAIAFVTVLHGFLIVRFPFDNLGVSKLVFGFYGLIDYGLVVAFFKLIEIVFGSPEVQQEP
jgi:hypothetical protein